jgi:hypothetical protein
VEEEVFGHNIAGRDNMELFCIVETALEASSGPKTILYEGLEVFYLCLDRI